MWLSRQIWIIGFRVSWYSGILTRIHIAGRENEPIHYATVCQSGRAVHESCSKTADAQSAPYGYA